MSLRAKLLRNYQAELEVVHNMQNSGTSKLESAIWDFTGEHEDDSLIPIDEVITELENRIAILAEESCTEEQAQELNY